MKVSKSSCSASSIPGLVGSGSATARKGAWISSCSNIDDVFCRISISFIQASLGAAIEIPTLNGTEKLKIPKGTQPGKIFRLKGKGISHLRGYGRGDQIIETVVTIPTDLNRKQEALLKEFAKLNGESID